MLYLFVTHRVALKMKVALEALLYRKVMSLSSEAALLTSSSVVVEQFSSLSDVFTEVSCFTVFILQGGCGGVGGSAFCVSLNFWHALLYMFFVSC